MRKAIILVMVLFVCIPFACKKEEKNTSFKIYHLEPNKIQFTSDTLRSHGWFAKARSDFFVVKNFDINNEQHKIKIDSFVLAYLKKDSFLLKNKNVKWSLTFFKYGNGIDENTAHEYNTDYTIHNLFSYKKEIGSFYFNTRRGYEGSNYRMTPEKINSTKRKIISDYFTTLDLSLDAREEFTAHLISETKNQDTIKVVARFIKIEEGNNVLMANYRVLKRLQGNVIDDTISVIYHSGKSPQKVTENSLLTLLEFDIALGATNYYYFPEYDGLKGSKAAPNGTYEEILGINDESDFNLSYSDYVILPYQSNWYWTFKNAKPGKLSQSELVDIDKILKIAIKNNNDKQREELQKYNEVNPNNPITKTAYELSLEGYKRQFVPIINNIGQKEVWINFFCEELGVKDWKTTLVLVEDGGNCYYSIKINLTTKTYYELEINYDA